MADVRRAAALVVDDGHLLPFATEVEHRAHEVASRPPEEPRRAHDPGLLAGCGLAVQLRPAVDRQRIRSVRLDVRLALPTVEDVVGREVDEGDAELGDVLRPADVHGRRLLRLRLRSVDVGPPCGVQNEVGLDGRGHGHIPSLARQPEGTGELLQERRAELAAGAGYDDASRAERIGDDVLHRWRTRSSSQGMPCSSGRAASYSSVTRYVKSESASAS